MRVVLIAAKALAFAKTRLASVLPPAERAVLAEAMYRDVLAAALSARNADAVAVVTSDASLLDLARMRGAIAIDEEYPRGLNVAVALATEQLIARGASVVCTVLSDIPMIAGSDIDEVLAAVPSGKAAVLVPSRDFSGTNVIARSPADVIPTQFGRLSLVRHLDDCRSRGVASQVLRLPRPALDLDLPNDLYEFVRASSTTHTLNQLVRLGISHH
ncbi:MAG: 2-phospho-L-lactate guanylyltransferase [Candidatus Binataceae bacterium]